MFQVSPKRLETLAKLATEEANICSGLSKIWFKLFFFWIDPLADFTDSPQNKPLLSPIFISDSIIHQHDEAQRCLKQR